MELVLARRAAETDMIANAENALVEAEAGNHEAGGLVVQELARLRAYVIDKYVGWNKEPPVELVSSVRSLGERVKPLLDEKAKQSVSASVALISCKTVDELEQMFRSLGV